MTNFVTVYNSEAESWEEIASAKRPKGYSYFCTSVKCCTKGYFTKRKDKHGNIKQYNYSRVDNRVLKAQALTSTAHDKCPDCGYSLMTKAIYHTVGVEGNNDAEV